MQFGVRSQGGQTHTQRYFTLVRESQSACGSPAPLRCAQCGVWQAQSAQCRETESLTDSVSDPAAAPLTVRETLEETDTVHLSCHCI